MSNGSRIGKNKRNQIEYNGYKFDSIEERDFHLWCEDAIKWGLINPNVIYQPEPIQLFTKTTIDVEVTEKLKTKTKVSIVEKTLLQSHFYSPDYKIQFTQKFFNCLNRNKNKTENPSSFGGFMFIYPERDVYIDIKGSFNRHGGDRTFSINNKWCFEEYGLLIQKIIPLKLFKATWCPEILKYTEKKKQPRKHYYELQSIKEFIGLI